MILVLGVFPVSSSLSMSLKSELSEKTLDYSDGLATVHLLFSWGFMLPSKWENLSPFSTKLIHVSEKLPLVLDCRQSKHSQ